MVGAPLFRKMGRIVSLAVGFCFLTAANPLAAGAVNCCQCPPPAPACGPPISGECGAGCTLVTKATCNGKTGQCTAAKHAFAPQSQDTKVHLTSFTGQLSTTRVEVPGTSR